MLLTIGIAMPAQAQDATPSHVYQVVDNVNAELALLHEANGSTPKTDKNAAALTDRRPRHVLQKAREVLIKVQTVRKLNGLAEKPVPAFPVTEVKPADVKAMVERILADVKDLRSKFNVSKTAAAAALPSGKTPTDVYANLAAAGLHIDGLGLPKTVPNEVYQVALTIIGDLKHVASATGMSIDSVAMQSGSKGKKPQDVYAAGFELLAALKVTTEQNPNFAIPAGVVMPNQRAGKVKPAHVMDVLNNALAEIGAIKVKVGAKTATEFAPAQSGKTPSDVYDAVQTAVLMVKAFQTSS
jgi:hypothetical protein